MHDKPKFIYGTSLPELEELPVCTASSEPEIVPQEEVEKILNEIGSEIIAKAQCQANQLVIDANLDSEKIKQQAQELGFAQGYEDGRKKADLEIKALMENAVCEAQTILTVAKQEAEDIVQSSQEAIMKVSFAIAEKILAQEIEKNEEIILPIITAALQELREQDQITVLVSPDDYETVAQSKKDLHMFIGGEKVINITPDSALIRGNCFVETVNGKLDARIDAQLAILKKTLQDLLP